MVVVTGIGGQDEKTHPPSGGDDLEVLNLLKKDRTQRPEMFIATSVASVPVLATASAALAEPNCGSSK